jgi:hypothetical protein
MDYLPVKKLSHISPNAIELSLALDAEKVPFHSINCVNWREYPYKPDVKFRIAHDGKNIFLNYRIDEEKTKAVCNRDNGKVWEDSCVEFFITFGEDDSYYNIESNCIGTILIGKGPDRQNRKHLPEAHLLRIDRWSSLGASPVDNRSGHWELSLIIPAAIFLSEKINRPDGIQAKGNFYKCGDKMETPHFLSWKPIESKSPDFHRPDFFGNILFE